MARGRCTVEPKPILNPNAIRIPNPKPTGCGYILRQRVGTSALDNNRNPNPIANPNRKPAPVTTSDAPTRATCEDGH